MGHREGEPYREGKTERWCGGGADLPGSLRGARVSYDLSDEKEGPWGRSKHRAQDLTGQKGDQCPGGGGPHIILQGRVAPLKG